MKKLLLAGVLISLLIAGGCAQVSPATDTGTGMVSTTIDISGFNPGDNITIPVTVYCSKEGMLVSELKEEYVDPGDTMETTAYFKVHQKIGEGDIVITSYESTDTPVLVEHDDYYIGVAGFNPAVKERRVNIEYSTIPEFTLFFRPPDHWRDGGYESPTQAEIDSWLPTAPIAFVADPGQSTKLYVPFSVPKGTVLPEKMAFFASLTTGINKSEETGAITTNFQTVSNAWILVSKAQSHLWFYLLVGLAGVAFSVAIILILAIRKRKRDAET